MLLPRRAVTAQRVSLVAGVSRTGILGAGSC